MSGAEGAAKFPTGGADPRSGRGGGAIRRLTAALALSALVAPGPGVGAAETAAPAPDTTQAREYFDAGRQAYDRGQFATAIAAFEEALRLSPRPSVIFSTAQAWRRQYVVDRDPKSLRRAVDLYRQYLGAVSEGGRRADAVQHLGDLEPLLLRVEPAAAAAPQSAAPDPTQLMVTSQTPGALASLDAAPLVEMPLIATVTPGRHRIRVEAPGHFPAETEGVAVESRLVVVPVALREAPARVAITAPPATLVHVDGLPVAETPLPGPLELPAGTHHLALGHNGYEMDARTLLLEPGATVPFDAELRATTQRKTAWGVFGTAGALVVGAGVFGALALLRENEAQDIVSRRDDAGENLSAADVRRYNEARDARDQWRNMTLGLGAGAAALLLLGSGLYFFDTPGYTAPRAAEPRAPAPRPIGPTPPATPGEEF